MTYFTTVYLQCVKTFCSVNITFTGLKIHYNAEWIQNPCVLPQWKVARRSPDIHQDQFFSIFLFQNLMTFKRKGSDGTYLLFLIWNRKLYKITHNLRISNNEKHNRNRIYIMSNAHCPQLKVSHTPVNSNFSMTLISKSPIKHTEDSWESVEKVFCLSSLCVAWKVLSKIPKVVKQTNKQTKNW